MGNNKKTNQMYSSVAAAIFATAVSAQYQRGYGGYQQQGYGQQRAYGYDRSIKSPATDFEFRGETEDKARDFEAQGDINQKLDFEDKAADIKSNDYEVGIGYGKGGYGKSRGFEAGQLDRRGSFDAYDRSYVGTSGKQLSAGIGRQGYGQAQTGGYSRSELGYGVGTSGRQLSAGIGRQGLGYSGYGSSLGGYGKQGGYGGQLSYGSSLGGYDLSYGQNLSYGGYGGYGGKALSYDTSYGKGYGSKQSYGSYGPFGYRRHSVDYKVKGPGPQLGVYGPKARFGIQEATLG